MRQVSQTNSQKNSAAEIYQNYHRLLMSVASKYRLSQEEKEDLVQDCYVRYLESAKTQAGLESAKGYLTVTLRNLVIDRARKCNTRKTESVGEDIADFEGRLWNSDYAHEMAINALGTAIDKIATKPEAASFAQFYRQGLSVKEISRKTGEPVSSITSKLSRLRGKHRDELRQIVENAMGDCA